MVDTPIVSETLQQSFRQNFPSQVSSGRDLHVSDVITPIVDFSQIAGTGGLGNNLQEAISTAGTFTDVGAGNSDVSIFTNTGFVRVFGVSTTLVGSVSSTVYSSEIFSNDGTTDYPVYFWKGNIGSREQIQANNFDFVVFLRSTDTLKATNTNNSELTVKCFQVATLTGTLVNPQGYTGS